MAESLPFRRGDTLYGATPDDTNKDNHLLGQEFWFTDDTYGGGRHIKLRVVRNASGVTVHGKKLAVLNALGTTILGLAATDAVQRVAPIDEKLTSAGCLSNDICYVVVKGPALCLTQIAVIAANVIAAGDVVNAVTINTTTGAITAGRIKTRALSSSVTANGAENDGVFGRAISAAATSGNTATDLLVDVDVAF